MGRAFEFRKARKFKRWGNMARVFTKLGKEITIAAKQGGPEPENNPRLRVLMQTAKKENMPKDNVERAIKRAVSKDFTDYKEMNYEGYGPFGIAIFVETATDNTTRTVANVVISTRTVVLWVHPAVWSSCSSINVFSILQKRMACRWKILSWS